MKLKNIKNHLSKPVYFSTNYGLVYGLGAVALGAVALGIMTSDGFYKYSELNQRNKNLIEINEELSDITKESLEKLNKCVQKLEKKFEGNNKRTFPLKNLDNLKI